jgi:hypothetical protein
MEHLLARVIDFEVVGPYTLRVVFDNGQERTINFEPVLYGHYYGPCVISSFSIKFGLIWKFTPLSGPMKLILTRRLRSTTGIEGREKS